MTDGPALLNTAFLFMRLIATDDDIEFKKGLARVPNEDMRKLLTQRRATRLAAESKMSPEELQQARTKRTEHAEMSQNLIELRAQQQAEQEAYFNKRSKEIVESSVTLTIDNIEACVLRAMREAFDKGRDFAWKDHGVNLTAIVENHELRAIADAAKACYEEDDFITEAREGDGRGERDQALGEALWRHATNAADRQAEDDAMGAGKNPAWMKGFEK